MSGGRTPTELADIIAAYLERARAGEAPDRERLLAQHPSFAKELKSFFAGHDVLKDATSEFAVPSRESGANDATLPPAETAANAAVARPALATSSEQATTVRYFGDYELIEEISRGGMGVVYKARQINLNRIVALKMILAGQLASDEDVQRFYSEAEAAANLDHPGIVPIYDVGEHEGQHYFSMGFVPGQTLAEVLVDGPLESEKAAEYCRQIAEAISYAHGRGVVHRDLKPANVLIDATGQPKVADFGVAKQMEGDSALTNTGQILGTPGFMPPEQAAGRIHEVNEAADVYSIGAILYALLSGRPPFQADSPIDTLVQVLESEATLPTKVNRQVPRQLELICMRCLEKKPADRYLSAQALAEDLDRFVRGDPVEARALNAWQQVRRWGRRQPALATHLSAIGIILFTIQVTYLLIGTNLSYHLQHTSLFVLWGCCATVLQQFVDRPRWSSYAAAAWAIVDAVLFTSILYLAEPPLGPLLIGYPLLIAATGLLFRVGLVVIMTIAAALSYVTLMALRPAEIGPPQYFVFFLTGLLVVGCVVISHVKRIRMLNRHFS